MRNKTIDIMKGITILLVVIWHNVGYYNGSIVFLNVVATFFMALFFLLSGYLSYGKVGDDKWLEKSSVKWFAPIAIFTLLVWVAGTYISHIYNVSLSSFIVSNILLGFYGVITWFLWCLILCYIIGWLIEKYHIKNIPLILQVLIVLILIQFIPVDDFGILSFGWYVIFFELGYLINYYRTNYQNIMKIANKISYAFLVIFPLCLYLFKWMIPYENRSYAFQGLAFVWRGLKNGQEVLIGVTLLMALLGIGFIFSLAKIINRFKLGKPFIYLGVSSIGIYLIHILFLGLVKNMWINILLSIILSIGLFEGFKRIKITNRLLFGGI